MDHGGGKRRGDTLSSIADSYSRNLCLGGNIRCAALFAVVRHTNGGRPMLRKLLIVFSVLLLGVTAAAAQSCPEFIKKRQTLMKKSGEEAKLGTAMIKGEKPFDLAKVQEIYAAFADDAKQMPTLFPDCSKTGAKTTAAPAIWEKMDDFKAAIAKFTADIKAAQDNTKDLDGLKAGFQSIGKNCSNCHQTFRIKTS